MDLHQSIDFKPLFQIFWEGKLISDAYLAYLLPSLNPHQHWHWWIQNQRGENWISVVMISIFVYYQLMFEVRLKSDYSVGPCEGAYQPQLLWSTRLGNCLRNKSLSISCVICFCLYIFWVLLQISVSIFFFQTLSRLSLTPFHPALNRPGICTTAVCHKNIRSGVPKITQNRSKPLTYEEAQPPYRIGVRKSWNSWNTCEWIIFIF